MKEKSFDIPLHDIKPLVEVQEYSFQYFLGVSFLVLCLALGVAYFIYKYIKKRDAFNIRRENIKSIKALNLKDTKKAAYSISFYGEVFRDDSPRHSEMFKNLTDRLEPYKYKKVVESFDKETLGYIELYREMLDV